jgi:ABC-type spermidine/putrescine transport system permease subunit II
MTCHVSRPIMAGSTRSGQLAAAGNQLARALLQQSGTRTIFHVWWVFALPLQSVIHHTYARRYQPDIVLAAEMMGADARLRADQTR